MNHPTPTASGTNADTAVSDAAGTGSPPIGGNQMDQSDSNTGTGQQDQTIVGDTGQLGQAISDGTKQPGDTDPPAEGNDANPQAGNADVTNEA